MYVNRKNDASSIPWLHHVCSRAARLSICFRVAIDDVVNLNATEIQYGLVSS